MTVLPLTLEASPFETPLSFASRLACRNRSGSLYSFAIDLDLNVRGLARGDHSEIARLCRVAGLSKDAFSKTMPSDLRHKYISVGCEIYRGNLFSRGSTRFCPQCVAEDVGRGGAYWQAVHKLHWQITLINRCAVHGCALVEMRSRDPSAAIEAFLLRGSMEQPPSIGPVGAFENYISQRAYGHQAPSWADNIEVFALWKAAMALGVLMEHGMEENAMPSDTQKAARMCDLGIDVIRSGPQGLRRCWHSSIVDGGSNFGEIPHFGAFQRLNMASTKCSHLFDQIRAIFRDYLIENFPFSSGAKVLGEPLEERRVHSVLSAQRAIGSRAKMFHQRLVDDGFGVPEASGRIRLVKPLKIVDFEAYAHEFEGLVYETEAAELVGIRLETFRLLAKAGVVPMSSIQTKSKHRAFDKNKLNVWVAALARDATALQEISQGQSVLSRAPVQLNCSMTDLVEAMGREALAPVGLLHGKLRLDHFVIDLDLARASLMRSTMPEGLKRTEAFHMLRFNNSTLNYLVEHGYLEEFSAVHPASRRMTTFICKHSIKQFIQDYVALGFLAEAEGEVGGPLFARLNNMGVLVFIDRPGLSKIYRRADLWVEHQGVGLDIIDELDD